MKNSERNLRVIQNFILYYTHDSEEMGASKMYQAALDYIEDDHVDGKDADEEEQP